MARRQARQGARFHPSRRRRAEAQRRTRGTEKFAVSAANDREEADQIGVPSRLARRGDPGGGEIFLNPRVGRVRGGLKPSRDKQGMVRDVCEKEADGVFTPAFSRSRNKRFPSRSKPELMTHSRVPSADGWVQNNALDALNCRWEAGDDALDSQGGSLRQTSPTSRSTRNGPTSLQRQGSKPEGPRRRRRLGSREPGARRDRRAGWK